MTDVKARPGTPWRTKTERADLVRAGNRHGLTDNEIARRSGLCTRTVQRIRHQLGLPVVGR